MIVHAVLPLFELGAAIAAAASSSALTGFLMFFGGAQVLAILIGWRLGEVNVSDLPTKRRNIPTYMRPPEAVSTARWVLADDVAEAINRARDEERLAILAEIEKFAEEHLTFTQQGVASLIRDRLMGG